MLYWENSFFLNLEIIMSNIFERQTFYVPDGGFLSGSRRVLRPDWDIRYFEERLSVADIDAVVCVDERKTRERIENNPVNLPGAIEIIIDELRQKDYTEEEAWRMVVEAGIPLGVHEHCGYAKVRQEHPEKVSTRGEADHPERVNIVRRNGGLVPEYSGDHDIKYAVINQRVGTSIDQNRRSAEGILSCDSWTVKVYADMLNNYAGKQILDPTDSMMRCEKVFEYLVPILNPRITTLFKIS